jgi:restriction endonuclease Mrr
MTSSCQAVSQSFSSNVIALPAVISLRFGLIVARPHFNVGTRPMVACRASCRRAQLVQPDQYGNIIYDRWIKDIDYFINTNLFKTLNESDLQIAREISSALFESVEQATSSKILSEPPHLEFNDNMTATEFEHYCAEELRRGGWDARVTMASRDQGVDVIAEKEGVRIVVQCKLYKSPVWNKAVQEIVAARTHENADYGIVVTNNSFTSSANELC